MKNNIYKNAEGYPDHVAGEAIKVADKQPQKITDMIEIFKKNAQLLDCEIVGRIQIKDKETGRIWR